MVPKPKLGDDSIDTFPTVAGACAHNRANQP